MALYKTASSDKVLLISKIEDVYVNLLHIQKTQ